jgi:hypothetical protein
LHSSFVTAAYGVRLIPKDFVRLAYDPFSKASSDGLIEDLAPSGALNGCASCPRMGMLGS